MTINKRRAPSSKISSEKKKGGHNNENIFASLIGGQVIKGTKKSDVKDKSGNFHSLKSGKKWQIFLYSCGRISQSSNLNILEKCQKSFPENYDQYLKDRILCISFKEKYISLHGRKAAKLLSNEEVSKSIGDNLYIKSKHLLRKNTGIICNMLKEKDTLRKFYNEALFNNDEVDYLTIKDSTNKNNKLFKIFSKDDVLNILTEKTYPTTSKAGLVPEDFNVEGQKILLCYKKDSGKSKNIIEIEVRNESKTKYRLIRFNMYSKDTLYLLNNLTEKKFNNKVKTYGQANESFAPSD
tara:strand:+ start:132 stop:1016 length:885 start_codon:yes stop_codon:yes gene_type:complete